jgi:hypothetical protein
LRCSREAKPWHFSPSYRNLGSVSTVEPGRYRAAWLSNTLLVLSTRTQAEKHMGDKSPKAKDKNKKQDSAVKNQKKTNASNKAGAVNASSKKGK